MEGKIKKSAILKLLKLSVINALWCTQGDSNSRPLDSKSITLSS